MENRPERSNLYYLFLADKKAHPMPERAVQRAREKILENFSKNLKLLNDPNPPNI